ncbi:MAG: hypothetical protein WB812_03440 [Woeseiaceae bacterium]
METRFSSGRREADRSLVLRTRGHQDWTETMGKITATQYISLDGNILIYGSAGE